MDTCACRRGQSSAQLNYKGSVALTLGPMDPQGLRNKMWLTFPCGGCAGEVCVTLIASLNRCCRFPPQLHQVLVQLQTGEKEQDFSLLPIQVSISVQLWRLPGCHEFLAALGETALASGRSPKQFLTLQACRCVSTVPSYLCTQDLTCVRSARRKWC